MIGREVAVSRSDVLEFPGSRVDDLNVTRDVAIPVHLTELIECLIGNLAHVQFVVAYNVSDTRIGMSVLATTDGQKIVIDILEDRIREGSIRGCSVTQAIAIMEVALNIASARPNALKISISKSTGIDEQQINAKIAGLVFHMSAPDVNTWNHIQLLLQGQEYLVKLT